MEVVFKLVAKVPPILFLCFLFGFDIRISLSFLWPYSIPTGSNYMVVGSYVIWGGGGGGGGGGSSARSINVRRA